MSKLGSKFGSKKQEAALPKPKKKKTENKEKSFEKFKKKHKESRIGKRLNEITTKQVIILVMVLILSLPCFNPDFWRTEDQAQLWATQSLHYLLENGAANTEIDLTFDEFVF